jgi:gluconolactonase
VARQGNLAAALRETGSREVTALDVRDKRVEAIVTHERLLTRSQGFGFTEGPVWSPAHTLVFSDITGDQMFEFDPSTEETTSYRQPSNKANGNVYDQQGRLLTCEHSTSRIVREETDGTLTVVASHYDGAEVNSPNDVIIDDRGRVLFTDPPYGRTAFGGVERPVPQPLQGVYATDPTDGTTRLLAGDFDRPNGLCLAEDGTVLFVNDTERKHIRRFEVRGDEVLGGDVWVEVQGEGAGKPDGLKVDAAGNVLCSGPGGIHVFSASGALLGVILVPEAVANFNWGDPDLMTLYICASTSLYSLRMKVPGLRSAYEH